MPRLRRRLGGMTSDAGFVPVAIRSPDGSTSAEFIPEANMLCCSLRHNGTEHLHVGSVREYVERGATTGIPLLHPWANRLDGFQFEVAGKRFSLLAGDRRIPLDLRDVPLPVHGVLPGLLRWQLDDGLQQDRVSAGLRWDTPELLELFPFVHELRIGAIVAHGELTIATTLRATGDDTVPVSFGFHPYLTLPGTDRSEWQLTLGAFRRLVVDDRLIPTGERVPVGQRSFPLGEQSLDAGFDALAVPAQFDVSDGRRTLSVTFLEGFHYALVWVPEGRDFICIEPMTAATNALRSGDGLSLVAPGEEYRAAFTVAISDAV